MDNVVIEKMNLSHLDSIKNILETDFDDFWNYNIFKSTLENENSKFIVVKINDEIIGFAGISVILDKADIENIVIKKSFRGKGFSSILLKELIDLARAYNCIEINLEVNSTNIIAINLYKKFGFEQVGLRQNYYDGQDDAILLQKLI